MESASPNIGNEIVELAEVLKALGHPSRLEIIRQLALRERCCGGDFCDCLPLAQSTISQHLDILKQARLVHWQQQGTRSVYSLNREVFISLGKSLERLACADTCHS
jgi:DNA-binding transcriptional ArsR family regulator